MSTKPRRSERLAKRQTLKQAAMLQEQEANARDETDDVASYNSVISNVDTTLADTVSNVDETSETILRQDIKTRTITTNSTKTKNSKLSKTHSMKHRQLQAEIEAEKRLLELEKKIIQKELKLKLLEIEEDSHTSSGSSLISKPSLKLSETLKKTEIENWVDKTKLQPVTEDAFFEPNPEHQNFENNMQKILARQSLKTDLPFFTGNPVEWPNFIEQFRETSKLCQMSDLENVIRLRKCLKGQARTSVQALLNIPNQLNKILATLERRFGRPDFIIEEMISQTQKLQPFKEDKLELLIDYADTVQNLTVTVQSLNRQNYLANPQLLKELVSKLPTNLKMKWAEEVRNLAPQMPILTDYSLWLQEIAEAVSFIASPKFVEFDKFSKKSSSKEISFTTSEKTKKIMKCLFCGKINHNIIICRKFLNESINSRWEWITKNKICFSCLRSGHHIRQCEKRKDCGENGCTRPHHPLLHNSHVPEAATTVKDNHIQETAETSCHTVDNKIKHVLLRVAPVKLKGPKKEIDTYALFDEASTVTLLDEHIAAELELEGETDPLCIQWTDASVKYDQNSRRVNVQISAKKENSKFFNLNGVRTVTNLSLPRQTINVEEISSQWPYLKKVPLDNMTDAKPTLIIGQDNWPLTIARDVIHGPWNGPVLSKTWLGWIIHGNLPQIKNRIDKQYTFTICQCQKQCDDSLHEFVKNFFKMDSLDDALKVNDNETEENTRALRIFNDTTRKILTEDRWETGLIWKEDSVKMPESKLNAKQRLKCIENKMDKDKSFAETYCKKMEEIFRKGYARKVSTEENDMTNKKLWYLPHFPVTNRNKPGKIRIVFDAATKSNGTSLNDNLLCGPDLLNNITYIIWKFRQKQIGFGADIKEMFPQVKIIKEDSTAQRFLWRGNDRKKEPETYEMTSMIFGAVCAPFSAQGVKNKNADEFYDQFPEACNAIKYKHYMDDYLDSSQSEEEAIKLIKEVINIHKNGGFTICNWICSSETVLSMIPEELRSNKTNVKLNSEDNLERVLGVWWNVEQDLLKFKLNLREEHLKILDEKKIPTKREFLKIMMSLFDPLGFIAPFIVHAKIILQEIWKANINWDEKITEDLNVEWNKWKSGLKNLENFSVPRCYTPVLWTASSVQLHLFCDASERAYATTAYFRVEKEGRITTSFITAKTRVAPLKHVTIPRLELQAALLASRLMKNIKEGHEIRIDKIFFWSDSKIVLSWINSDTYKFKQFVGNRVTEIKNLTNIKDWRWVPSKENVADLATRLLKTRSEENRWLTGPDFLLKSEENWPEQEQNSKVEKESSEMKKEFIAVTNVKNVKLCLPDICHFSKLSKLLRSTAWMLRFINNCLSRIRRKNIIKLSFLDTAEIDAAEKLWIKQAQGDSFQAELSYLTNQREVNKASRLYQLSPEMDEDGIIRIKGRIDEAPNVDRNLKHPAILDGSHSFTKLLLQNYHEMANHQGKELVLNEVRQKYYIPKIRSAINRTWYECQICKNNKSKPLVPPMGSLPVERLSSYIRPFTFTGVDFFGPMEVTVGRRREKRYGVIFTCLTIRAIHLEIAASLSTDSTIMAIRRMAARRGPPKKIFSDNGTNFRGADNELKKILNNLDNEKIASSLLSKGIDWHFICPNSPHMGGCWERLIRSVKTSLKIVLKERAPKEECLQTLITEIENMVNSRPLTHVSTDAHDRESLTPNHFLFNSTSGQNMTDGVDILLPPGEFYDDDIFLRKQWRIAQRFADYFWKRWVREYLPTLVRRTKWHENNKNLKIGDTVLIVDNNMPRNVWLRGKIMKLFPGKDNKVRVVDVKTSSGILRRPATKLCKIGQ